MNWTKEKVKEKEQALTSAQFQENKLAKQL